MIAIVDYGVGNLLSVRNMLAKAGAQAEITNDPEKIRHADKLLLPGVGHIDHAMRKLDESGLREVLDEVALKMQKPVLGICLGSQILGRGSEEGALPGLGWIDMFSKRLPVSQQFRVPHMGWNEISPVKECALFTTMQADARFYFVHSYYMECADPEDVAATVSHGITFTCAVQKGNIYGTQFHPEKSLKHGLALMRAFDAI